MQDKNFEVETVNMEEREMSEKKKHKILLTLCVVGVALVIALIIIIVFGVRYLKSDGYRYRSMLTEKLPMIYTEEELRNLKEGDECYLLVTDMDWYEAGYFGYLMDEKKHDTEAQVVLEIPIWAHWVTADDVIAKVKYIKRDRMVLREEEGKENFYRFELMEVAALDGEYQISSDITQVELLRRKTKLDVGDLVSVALTGSKHASSIEYKDEVYYVFNYLDVDYDYDEMDEICKVQSDKKFIVADENDVFHIDTSIDIDFIKEIRESILDGLAVTLVDASVIDITQDGYYVLKPCESPVREQYLTGIDTDKNTYSPVWEDDTNVDTFDEFFECMDDMMREDDEMYIDCRLLLFGEEKEVLAHIDELREEMNSEESKIEQTLSENADDTTMEENNEAATDTTWDYETYEDVMNGNWFSEINSMMQDYNLPVGTIIRCKASDITWVEDTAIISGMEIIE